MPKVRHGCTQIRTYAIASITSHRCLLLIAGKEEGKSKETNDCRRSRETSEGKRKTEKSYSGSRANRRGIQQWKTTAQVTVCLHYGYYGHDRVLFTLLSRPVVSSSESDADVRNRNREGSVKSGDKKTIAAAQLARQPPRLRKLLKKKMEAAQQQGDTQNADPPKPVRVTVREVSRMSLVVYLWCEVYETCVWMATGFGLDCVCGSRDKDSRQEVFLWFECQSGQVGSDMYYTIKLVDFNCVFQIL